MKVITITEDGETIGTVEMTGEKTANVTGDVSAVKSALESYINIIETQPE